MNSNNGKGDPDDASAANKEVTMSNDAAAAAASPSTFDDHAIPTSGDVQERARALYRGELLAPMVRASTTPLRTLALHYGAHATYTEELVDRSVMGTKRVVNTTLNTIDYVKDPTSAENQQQQPSSKKRKKHKARQWQQQPNQPLPVVLRIDPKLEQDKLICQFGSGEPELARQAAMRVHQDVSALDLNMGCPKKFSVSGGMGCALLQDPDRACAIVRTWRDMLPHMPVSAKIRLRSPDNPQPTLDLIHALVERGGIHALTIHGRTVGHESVEPANWSMLEEVVVQTKCKYPNLSVLINGDFYARSDFADFTQRTGADGVLLARPALYNMSLFRQPTAVTDVSSSSSPQTTFGYDSPLLLDKTRVVQDYLRLSLRYDTHFKNVKYVVCEMMNNRRAPSTRTPFLPQRYAGHQTIGQVCNCKSLPEICKLWDLDVNNSNDNDTNKSFASKPQQQAPAGEHRYEDGYLLQTMGSETTPTETTNAGKKADSSPLLSNKRTKVS